MKIGFAMITEESYVRRIVEIEKRVSGKYQFLNDLGLVHNLPHTTIYQGDFSDEYDYENALNSIRDKALSVNRELSLRFNDIKFVPSGWYFYCCEITDELKEIHNFTMDLIQDHILLPPDRMNRDLSYLTKDQIEAIRIYGYRYSRKAFFPHITLGRTKEDENLDLLKTLKEEFSNLPGEARIERLTVYEMGENGTHRNTRAELYLI